jgi:hypothetical protein
VHGTGARRTGELQLTAADARALGREKDRGVVEPSGLTAPLGTSQNTFLGIAGDVDGDGNCDILTEGAASGDVVQPGAAVTFIPSTPRTPD